ncbi:HepT-like ribonuclease domain-containing protein [Pseudomonas aeruginosa]|nr:hypothetical protein [Pseudomonas aeruginosa]HEP9092655.1 hypothetical protein [Pseudomonas aeruginosa]
MKLEYLAIISSDNSFCQNSSAFKNLLQSDSEIKIQGKKIKHKSFEVDYELQEGFNEEKKHRFFHLRLKTDSDSVDDFSKMGRAIKKMLNMPSEINIQTLWDDVSFHYSKNSYPLIHEIENLMRKLITKFMLTNVGLGWSKDTIPEEIKKSSRAGSADGNNNYLYEVDFIQLSDFLFNEYRTLDLNTLAKKISEIKTDSVNVEEISEFIPKSNWKRYFEPYVDCDANYLQSRWQRLYEMRCKIAHNNSFNKSDYLQTLRVAEEVKEKLEKAIESLDAISVPEDDREELAESVVSHISLGTANFVQKWKMVERLAIEIHEKYSIDMPKSPAKKGVNTYQLFSELARKNIISSAVYLKIKEMQKFRNIMVHEMTNPFSVFEITLLSKRIDEIIEDLHRILNSPKVEAG